MSKNYVKIAMKCNFVTETDISKKYINSPPIHRMPFTKLNSQSAIFLTQFLYQVDVEDDILQMILYGL